MTPARIRSMIALVLMVAAFAGAAIWKPTVHLSDQKPKLDLATVFPSRFGDWVVDDRMPVQLVSPDQEAVLNKIYNQTLSRTYVNRQGQRVMLSVAYGGDQSDGTRAHRPEICYPAQGFQIVNESRGKVTVDSHSVSVRKLVAKQGGRIEPIIYWVVVGERIANSGTEQKLAQLAYSTRGLIPDGMLVRVSSIDADAQRAFGVGEGFIGQLAAALPAAVRSRIVGAGAA